MKFLSKLDKGLVAAITVLTGILVAAIMIIVNIQVVGRYVFKISLGPISDMPPYLMIFTIWISSIIAARKGDHIKIEVLDMVIKSKLVLRWIKIFIQIVTVLAMGCFAYYSFLYVADAISQNTYDPSLKIPYWCLYLILPVSSTLMTVYFAVNAVKTVKGGENQ